MEKVERSNMFSEQNLLCKLTGFFFFSVMWQEKKSIPFSPPKNLYTKWLYQHSSVNITCSCLWIVNILLISNSLPEIMENGNVYLLSQVRHEKNNIRKNWDFFLCKVLFIHLELTQSGKKAHLNPVTSDSLTFYILWQFTRFVIFYGVRTCR